MIFADKNPIKLFYVAQFVDEWVVIRRTTRCRRANGNEVCQHATRRQATLCCWGRNGSEIYRSKICKPEEQP